MPDHLNSNSWYDLLFHDLNRSGILLRKAQVINESRQVNIEISNYRYELAADAINRVLTFSEIHLPRYIKHINIILNEDRFRVMTFSYQRMGSSDFFSDAVAFVISSFLQVNASAFLHPVPESANLKNILAVSLRIFTDLSKHSIILSNKLNLK